MNVAFASLNIVGAVMVAVLMMETTPQASIRRSLIDKQAMWGMLRRLFYVCFSGGLAGKAFWIYEGWDKPTTSEMVFWLMVTIPIGFFLLLRALKAVDQDQWVGFRKNESPIITRWK